MTMLDDDVAIRVDIDLPHIAPVRMYSWYSIVRTVERLDLSPHEPQPSIVQSAPVHQTLAL